MLLVNVPVPLPSVVWLSVTTGFELVDQHTPRAVTALPPSEDTFPPDTALVPVIDVGVVVETVGATAIVENCRSLPYAVPLVFVA
jgi:hypothetical protein